MKPTFTAPEPTAAQMLHTCLRKNRYPTEVIANAVAKKCNRKRPPEPGKKFNAYYCPLCGGFHIGRRRINGPPFAKTYQPEGADKALPESQKS